MNARAWNSTWSSWAGPAGWPRRSGSSSSKPEEISVVVVEKGAEVGAHILSGAVVDPIGVDRLLPDWREDADHPFKTPVTDDQFYCSGPAGSLRLPNLGMPPLMNNHGNYIVSLGNVCRWLAARAEALGVEIYPGFAAAEVLYDDEGACAASPPATWASIATAARAELQRGMELRASTR
jgi:electron-transferring-flavoprotein dehydrogenase